MAFRYIVCSGQGLRFDIIAEDGKRICIAHVEAVQPEVEEIASRLRRRHEYLYGKDAVGSVLTEAADLIERLATAQGEK